jgi:hypothetical protein
MLCDIRTPLELVVAPTNACFVIFTRGCLKDLGGTCEQKLTAGSWDEMVKAMTKHVMENHPDVAKQMEGSEHFHRVKN